MNAKGKKRISLKLTPEQQKQIQQAIGKNAQALELTTEELEERIAPSFSFGAHATGGGSQGVPPQ